MTGSCLAAQLWYIDTAEVAKNKQMEAGITLLLYKSRFAWCDSQSSLHRPSNADFFFGSCANAAVLTRPIHTA